MTDDTSGTRTSVGLLDIAGRLPSMLLDAPTILRGVITGFGARPSAKTSIGKVFQDRAAKYGDKVFIKFGDEQISYREANETANRYAAVLAARGVGHGDVVGMMLRNSPEAVLVMLAAVKCGAIAGMLNYHQRGDVLKHSLGLLGAKAVVAETDFVDPITESGADTGGLMTDDELKRLAATAPTTNPATTAAVLAKDKAFYIFTSGTTGMPKASVMTHYRRLRALAGFGALGMRLHGRDTLYCCLPLYHNNALTVALSSVLSSGATLALGRSFSASKFWDEVIRFDATAFVYIGEICTYLLNQPPRAVDRQHKVRVICGNGLRPAIWDQFTERFGIARVCEFYAASEGNTAFVNVFNIDKTTGICPSPVAFVEYDADTGEPARGADGRVRKVRKGEPGLLLSKISSFQPFDGYTDKEASEKKLVRNVFRDGDVWFNTGDLMRSQGFGHAAFIDRLGDTFRWKGRTSRPPRWSRPSPPTRRSRRPRCSASRCPVPAAGRAWPRSSSRTARSSTVRRWPRRSTTSCPATRCRCSCGWSPSSPTPRRSRVRRSICARRATAPTSRTPSTCCPAAKRATSSSTRSTPTT